MRLIVEDEDTVGLALDDWGPISARLDGRTRRVRGPEGDRLRLSMRFSQGRLIERHQAGQGTRQNVFSLSPDATRLMMDVSIAADPLPAEIRYRLVYRRSPRS